MYFSSMGGGGDDGRIDGTHIKISTFGKSGGKYKLKMVRLAFGNKSDHCLRFVLYKTNFYKVSVFHKAC